MLPNWDDKGVEAFTGPKSGSTFNVHVTGWSKGLDVTSGGSGIVSHAGLVLLRDLADKTGLTAGLSKALATPRLLIHDRGADLAVAIAGGAEVISDFAVLGGLREVAGPVASVPTAWRTLNEIAAGGSRAQARVTRAVNAARRHAWAGIEGRHGAIPGVAVADKKTGGVICIRLDATVTPACSEKEGAEPNYKGSGHHPLLAYCDNTAEPLAGMLRPGSAGSNTTADHLQVLDEAITAVPAKYRRRLMVTCDGAGASHGLIARLDELASRPGRQLTYSIGWGLVPREREAITAVPGEAWQIAIDPRGRVRARRTDGSCADLSCACARCWREEAHVSELTGLLREGPGGDQLAGWPAGMRVFARRERPHPAARGTRGHLGPGGRDQRGFAPGRAAMQARQAGRRRPRHPCGDAGLAHPMGFVVQFAGLAPSSRRWSRNRLATLMGGCAPCWAIWIARPSAWAAHRLSLGRVPETGLVTTTR